MTIDMTFFKHKGINLYYETSGEGQPLLLINGLAGDTRQWAPLINGLTKSFQVISYDMRCAGKSGKPNTPFTIADIADEAFDLMSYLGYTCFSVLGFSMGGIVAMDLALRHPDCLSKIFLVATTPSIKRPYPPSEDIINMMKRIDISPALLSLVYDAIFGSRFKMRVSADDFVKFRLSNDNPQPTSAYLNQLNAVSSCDLYDEIAEISTDAVIIAGDEDKIIPCQNSEWLNNHIKNSKIYILKGLGHMIPVEAPNELAEILVSYA